MSRKSLCGCTLAIFIALVAPTLAATGSNRNAAGETARHPAVAALIQQLGDEQFSVRRRAEEQLIRLGPEAFDDLRAAEEDADLEIAERARYILLRMRVDWVRPEDPPEVRRALTRYGELSREEKEKRIARLAELKEGAGLPALCRIARLDASALAARQAAMALLKSPVLAGEQQKLLTDCERELNGSERPPVVWARLWLREAADRRATLAEWDQAVEAEAALLAADSPDTASEIVYPLLLRHLQGCHEFGTVEATAAALLRIADLRSDHQTARRRMNNLAWALQWIIAQKRWDVLEHVVDQRGEELRGDRRLLYYLAAATSGAGRQDEAARLADKAYALGAAHAKERVDVANALVELGFVDWAEREYRRALDDLPIVSWDSLRARREWAMWLHDREEHAKAAEVLDEFFQKYRDDRAARQQLIQQLDGQEYVNALAARAEYYRACDFAAQHRFDKEREALENAWRLYDDDPDILIAMYRSQGADDAYRQQTRKRIQEMSQRHLALIEQYPDEPSFHNQWAWLISNTEGDYARAVEQSKRSLELQPDEPSYLDTLGRCYYAAGDLKKAVETQRKAVELSPHYGVMRRQLALFERELAAKGGS